MARARIGEAVRRKEDLRLVKGAGRYADDITLPGLVHAAMVRAPHAHARIRGIDTAAAEAMPGVLAVLTGADAEADGLKSIPHATGSSRYGADVRLANLDGSERLVTPHPPLVVDVVRFAGEPVAMVVAESAELAKDAAELVEVDYELLPAVTATADAARPDAPQLWAHVPGNVTLEAEVGDAAATAAAFAKAAHRVRLDTWVQRVTGVHMEPRAALAEYEPTSGKVTLHASFGIGAVVLREQLATVLGMPEDKVRAVAPPDVGGNFGTRNAFYPEFALIAWAAKRLSRPVKHVAERHEAFLTDYQGRDLDVEAELALDADGRFLALRATNLSNLGAHTASFVALNKGVQLMTSVYRVPAAHVRARAVLSNTVPTIPYRSAGRPEVMFVIERLVDLAARQCGFDRVELRRKNLVSAAEMPYTNPIGLNYDSGDYVAAMDAALKLGDFAGFPARKAEARRRGRLRGISIACYVEATSGQPRERAEVIVLPDGKVEVIVGTQSTGQGHETSFAQLVSEWLCVPMEDIAIRFGDTAFVVAGGGSHSGRSMRFASIVMRAATDEVLLKGKELAGAMLEAASADIDFRDGRFVVAGTDRGVDLFEVAAAATTNRAPEALRGPLGAVSDQVLGGLAFPYGAHVCEVEVDPDTGRVTIVRYAAVDDVGRAVNPLIVEGQTHGGIAQGVGQALFEHCVSDPQTGQPLAGSFMDYAMPRADSLPSLDAEISENPSTAHPLGFRPGGEGGTTPSLGSTINAVVDALAEYGITHIEMPATPLRVWQAIQDAKAKRTV